MLKVLFIALFIGLAAGEAVAQGLGGGVWLEDGASCVGSVIHKNLAKEGFGVAGKNGTLLNCSVTDNQELVDKSYFPRPGDIYCANGDLVDRNTYKARAVKDAIGIVFWINGDPDCRYPQGAVVALDAQEKLSWGDASLSICGPVLDEWGGVLEPEASNFLKDTACYGNTQKMEQKWTAGNLMYEAGHFCWIYKAYYQLNNPQAETAGIRWCMPVLQYLRRLAVALPDVEQTLEALKITNGEIGIKDFVDSDANESNYWSSDDGSTDGTQGTAWYVNFKTSCTFLGDTYGGKGYKNWVRPIFLY